MARTAAVLPAPDAPVTTRMWCVRISVRREEWVDSLQMTKTSGRATRPRIRARRPTAEARPSVLLAEAELEADHQERVVHVPLVVSALADEVRELARDADRSHHHVGAKPAVQSKGFGVAAGEDAGALVVPVELLARAGDQIRLDEDSRQRAYHEISRRRVH